MNTNKVVVLFDGVCNLCNTAVQFLIRNNPNKDLYFAPLQSEFAQNHLALATLNPESLDSFVLLEYNKAHTHSGAALRVTKYLKRPWPLLQLCLIIPSPLRDFVYTIVARHRYQWFGRTEACMLPSPELQKRFLT